MSDPFRPSFFEVAGQERIASNARAALKYALNVLASRNPRLQWMARNADAVYYCLQMVTDSYCLRWFDASFSEHILGLCREPVGHQQEGRPKVHKLSGSKRALSLLFLIAIPWIKHALEDEHASRNRNASMGLGINDDRSLVPDEVVEVANETNQTDIAAVAEAPVLDSQSNESGLSSLVRTL